MLLAQIVLIKWATLPQDLNPITLQHWELVVSSEGKKKKNTRQILNASGVVNKHSTHCCDIYHSRLYSRTRVSLFSADVLISVVVREQSEASWLAAPRPPATVSSHKELRRKVSVCTQALSYKGCLAAIGLHSGKVGCGPAPTEVRGHKSQDSNSFIKTPPGDEDQDIICKHGTSLRSERRVYTPFSHWCSGNPVQICESHTVTNTLPHCVFDHPAASEPRTVRAASASSRVRTAKTRPGCVSHSALFFTHVK